MNSHPPVCPRCHQPIPPGAAHGVCPACLLAAGFATEPAAASAKAPPPSIEELAPLFPQLEIIALLGRGGMGAVYKARQKSLDRFVALKLLAPERASDPAFAERFAQEAQALARLDHPHIVTIHDFGQTGDRYYLVMELVDGLNLRHLIDRGRLDPREALAIVPQVCDALQFAHDHGIVHRDIKPENILVDRRGQVKVADFGLAKLMGADETADESRRVMGTPRYMAPEQREQPEQVDHRADIYALGVVLYQMLTGELPDERQLCAPSHRVRVDVRLDEVVLRALEKDPSRRYASASEFKTAVTEGTSAPPPSVATDDVLRRVSGPAIALIVTAGLNGAGTIVVLLVTSAGPSRIDDFTARLATLSLLGSVLTLVGACKMRHLTGYRWAVAASAVSILAVQSLGVGVTVGLWALIVLSRDDVREAFDARSARLRKRVAPSHRTASSAHESPAAAREGPDSDRDPLATPALGLLIASGMNLFATLLLGLGALIADEVRWDAGAIQLTSGGVTRTAPVWVTWLPVILSFVAPVATFLGAWQMRRRRSLPLAVAGSVLAVLGVQGLGLGAVFGVWSLLILSRRDVRASFMRAPLFRGMPHVDRATLLAAALMLAFIGVGASLVDDPAPTAPSPHLPGPRPAHMDLGKLHKRVLPLSHTHESGLFSLADDRLLTTPGARSPVPRVKGVYICYDPSQTPSCAVVGVNDFRLSSISPEQWERFDDLASYRSTQSGSLGGPPKYTPGRHAAPYTFVFDDGQGSGVMQITPDPDRPRTVVVRWKYFTDATRPSSAAPVEP